MTDPLLLGCLTSSIFAASHEDFDLFMKRLTAGNSFSVTFQTPYHKSNLGLNVLQAQSQVRGNNDLRK